MLSMFRVDMNSDKLLQTAAIFFLSNLYLKLGIGWLVLFAWAKKRELQNEKNPFTQTIPCFR